MKANTYTTEGYIIRYIRGAHRYRVKLFRNGIHICDVEGALGSGKVKFHRGNAEPQSENVVQTLNTDACNKLGVTSACDCAWPIAQCDCPIPYNEGLVLDYIKKLIREYCHINI